MAGICLAVQNLNGDKWLNECLSSIVAMIKASSTHYIKTFVLDAGSTDRSLEIIKQYPFDLIQHDMLTQSAAMNLVFKKQLENFDYFSGINNDDMWLPNFVNIQVREMLKYPDTDLSHCGCIFYTEKNNSCFVLNTSTWEDSLKNKRNNICHPSMFYARKCFQKYGFFDEKIINPYDFEYSARVWHNGGVIRWINSEPLVFYRSRPDNLTHTKKDITDREVKLILERYWKE